MSKVYWLFLVLAIACALLSDKIDAAVNAGKKLKKVILVFSAGVFMISVISIMVSVL